MAPDFDVIIVGTGPAGTSAAYPLVEAGIKVLLVDPATPTKSPAAPTGHYLLNRANDAEQWKWMLGENFHAINQLQAVSPKLRVPTLAHVFQGYCADNKIEANGFTPIGSLATGGLSNAWGCGVARFSENCFPEPEFDYSDLEVSYASVAKRIGISGAANDDLSNYYGLDEWSQPPLPLDGLHQILLDNYYRKKSSFINSGFRLGRSRVAALSQDLEERKACDLSDNCMWGCDRKSLYSASQELPKLKRHDNCHHVQGFLVDDFFEDNGFWTIVDSRSERRYSARKLIFAAGTLASTRLILKRLEHTLPRKLLSSPTAAFLLWLPRKLGAERTNAFGLGQLSFAMDIAPGITGCGSTLSTTGLPVSEFLGRLPMSKRYGIDFLRNFLNSCVVGNMFLPGHLSDNFVSLRPTGELLITGGVQPNLDNVLQDAKKGLRKAYEKLGAVLMPMSFTAGQPGTDIHYAGTLPMRTKASVGESNLFGEIAGLPSVHVVDGSCLPILSEQAHTLTIMANADRIGRYLTRD